MPKRKVAEWRKVGKVFYAKPPDWPKATEYSCTDQETLIEWAHNHGLSIASMQAAKRFAAEILRRDLPVCVLIFPSKAS